MPDHGCSCTSNHLNIVPDSNVIYLMYDYAFVDRSNFELELVIGELNYKMEFTLAGCVSTFNCS